ncbi:hypothetical protein I203_107946 [Kwoniella mangroviensis CBS 8507]|uniref:hypothetical protein n=1 Tax=Kwoniella mangroviensis CBS 8507 TaxID=1296122 RepID=UPI003023AEB8
MSDPSYPNETDRQSGASGLYRSAPESSQYSWYSTQQYPQQGASKTPSGNYHESAQGASGNGQPNSQLSTEHKRLKFYAESMSGTDEEEAEEMNRVVNKLILPIAFQRSPTLEDINQIIRDTFGPDCNLSSAYRTRPSNPIYCQPPPPAWGRPHHATTRWDKDHI